MKNVETRTWGTEEVPGEYHGPALREDLCGIERVLEAALEDRRAVVHHAGGKVARDRPALDIMRALEATMVGLSPTGYKFKWLATWWLWNTNMPMVDIERADHLTFDADEWNYARHDSGTHVLTRGRIVEAGGDSNG